MEGSAARGASTMNRFIHRMALVLLVLCFSCAAHAYLLYVSDENPDAFLRWFEPRMSYVIDSQESQEISFAVAEEQIVSSFAVWTQLNCGESPTPFDFEYGGVVSGRSVGFDSENREDNENLVIWVQSANEWLHPPAVLALTSLTYDTKIGQIVDADVEINDAGFVFSADAMSSEIDLRNTLVHEVGHVLGLDHSQEPGATMFDKAPPGEIKKRDLESDDIEGFCALYGPNAVPMPPSAENTGKSNSGCVLHAYSSRGLSGVYIVGLALLCLLITRGRRATGPCR